MQRVRAVLVSFCLCGAFAAQARVCAQDRAKAPSMKRPVKTELPPSHLHKFYDRARDATYINVDITLFSRLTAPTATAREVKLTFQLIYKGATTADLKTAYLFVASAAPAAQPTRLSACKQVEIKADAYEFAYARTDYQTAPVTLTNAPPGTPSWQRETLAFALTLDDLPQLANAGRLQLKLCAETFTANSVQLTDLRNTLTSGAE